MNTEPSFSWPSTTVQQVSSNCETASAWLHAMMHHDDFMIPNIALSVLLCAAAVLVPAAGAAAVYRICVRVEVP